MLSSEAVCIFQVTDLPKLSVAAIVDDRLFFCSGNYTFDDDGQPRHTTASIFWIYLNETLDVTGPLDMALLGSAGLPDESLNGGKNPDPGGFAGTFFYDHTTIYPYAGLVGPEADGVNNNELYAFNSSDNSWKQVQVEGGKISFGENSEGVYASDPRTGTSFYTGGWVTAYNGTYNGTVKFRSSNSGTPYWSFETAVAGMQGPNILKGSMVYVRKGQAGILIAFGGYQTAYQGTEIPDWPWDQRPFSEIFIYDIQTSTWYHQTATGDLPELRTEFCAAVSAAPDDSSFQITIHGGWDQLNRRAFNDVYVLSVPSFRWIKVEDSNNPDLVGIDQPGRNRHKCDMWNETSMIVSGGQLTLGQGDTVLLTDMCNPQYPPIKVLDTSTYIWQTEFNPILTYSVPEVVTNVIGGDSSGGASLTEPELGWETDDLRNIFSQTVIRDTYVPPERSSQNNASDPATDPITDPIPDPITDPKDPSDPNEDKTNDVLNSSSLTTGAIAGIVVGAVAALAGVFAAVFLCCRRRKYQAADQSADQATPSVSSFTSIPLVKRWHKPELDATVTPRYELSTENNVYEVHGDDRGKQNQIVHDQQIGGSSPAPISH
ncbi:hypothetical protein E0Z10_g5283 [Xylaria hypoxylon]|uniref:Kelch repeat protein n=1 Tax=Xylaria hypoxylon TaxID=37992 RepID=A0A4Z0YHM0_9PEZI|nr:hypothetical protein E0Z10_g5283 [Xylaria hypoxylon]